MYSVDDCYDASLKPPQHASALLTEPDKCPEYGSREFLIMFPIIGKQLIGAYEAPANIRILLRFQQTFSRKETLNEEYRLRVLGAAANGYGD